MPNNAFIIKKVLTISELVFKQAEHCAEALSSANPAEQWYHTLAARIIQDHINAVVAETYGDHNAIRTTT